MTVNDPREWGVPHDKWRPGQLAGVEWAVNIKKSALLNAATGSGKTATATAIGHRYRTLSVCSTKNLQDQYGDYDWFIMKGKGNYPCMHPQAESDATADDCLFDSMSWCDLVSQAKIDDENSLSEYDLSKDECPYHHNMTMARSAKKLNINYHLWFMAKRSLNLAGFPYVVADEAHLLPDLVLNFTGTTINMKQVRWWGLSPPPRIPGGLRSTSFSYVENPTPLALKWLRSSAKVMEEQIRVLKRSKQVKDKKKLRSAERLLSKLNTTVVALSTDNTDWYIASGHGAVNGESGFIAKPLTARRAFPGLSGLEHIKLMIMSATIGDPNVLAEELGIKEFEYRSVPSVWTPDVRPVDVLDVPGMGQTTLRKNPKAPEKQADEIAKYIKKFPGDWPGLILVSRISEAKELATRLSKRGLSDRVYPIPVGSTSEQLASWERRKKRRPNSIGVSWSFWEGFDGVDEKIAVIAKVPFPALGSSGSYDRERCDYNPDYYRQRAALKVEQGAGRVRRGNKEDYNIMGEVRTAVAIADGNIRMVKRYLSDSFRESMRKDGG